MMQKTQIKFVFFGTSKIAVGILDALENAGFVPSLIITAPDSPQGRGMQLTEPPTKTWAKEHEISYLQPANFDSPVIDTLQKNAGDVFVVVDYGKILPKKVLDIPRRGCLNVHFSLLPKYRGASPMRSAILQDDKEVGTSIMLLAEKLDEGPIVAQKRIDIAWPPRAHDLESVMVVKSGELLVQILPEWVAGNIEEREQNHDVATYSKKIKKEDGLLNLLDDPYKNLLKIYALEGWPGTYSFFERNGKRLRVAILSAHLSGGPSTGLGASTLVIDTVKPEGKKEMRYEDFLRSGATPVN